MATNANLVCVGPVKRGRPSSYTQEIADEICERIAEGETLSAICMDEHIPNRATIGRWLIADLEGFSRQYARARELQGDVEFDQMRDIADESGGDVYIDAEGNPRIDGEAIQRAKLRIETRRWRAERLNRRVYGQKVEHEHEHVVIAPVGEERLPPGADWLARRLESRQRQSE